MDQSFVIGIDIGGTKIAAAAVSVCGNILSQRTIPTEAERGFDDGLRRMKALIERVLASAGCIRSALAAIGIGCSGPVDPVAGTIDNPYTLPTWDGVNIVEPLRAEFAVPVVLENDADAAAMGEVWLGAGQGGRIVIMVTIGTGIGGGIIIDGRIYRGARGTHPEIGHHSIDLGGPECYCGIRGCWEALASGPAMATAAQALMPERPPTSITGATVVSDARSGHPIAQKIVARTARVHALGVFNLINLYVPDIIVLGGGVMDAYDLFAPAIDQIVKRNTMVQSDRVSIRKAVLGNDAGVIGAARIALDMRE
jgi:glucokinase